MNDPAERLPLVATALRGVWRAGYGLADLRSDVLAGLAVGTVAVPLSMALAIATGVPPQYGLYTAIIAGAVIALAGGSRFNVSGPTAAFVVILFPIVQQYGLGGLLVATLMAGLILIGLGAARMGRLVKFVPFPVVLGFTAGIAVVIAVMQLPDLLGMHIEAQGTHFLDSVGGVLSSLSSIRIVETTIGLFTLCVLVVWARFRLPLPAPLVGLVAGTVLAMLLNYLGMGGDIETIATRFAWESHGRSGSGIPPIAPGFLIPWRLAGPDGQPLELSFELIRMLLGPAFAIAILAAIESLLCAVIADGLTNTRHDPNAELIGQGLGNLVAPFLGGITATAAIARTATSIRSGARSPLAAVVHAGVVLLAVLLLADVLGMVPMASLAALLLVVAWNMSKARHFFHTLRSAPRGDVTILATCFVLTVVFDMVLAVGVGIGLAAALFVRRMALLTHADRVANESDAAIADLPREVAVFDVNGPLFFGAAENALMSLRRIEPEVRAVIIDMNDVSSMDGTSIEALKALVEELRRQDISLALVGLPTHILVQLRRSGIRRTAGFLTYSTNIGQARSVILRWLRRRDGDSSDRAGDAS